ncbi:hypothetical protein KQH49_08340 [Mycetohabitans sp. B5]|uniref:hypothetical protein n=1 Tax=Mycetohabitans TaxID=2571159 RepID=UPI0011B042A8|nr:MULTISPECIES: hypothetical protein [Mycetohabitans]MCG1054958.1 hypothetical protein [Mycetohabitans sp. B5]
MPGEALASLSVHHSMTLSRRRDDYYCATNKVSANGYMSSVQPTHASKTGRLSHLSDLVHAVRLDRLVLRGTSLQFRRTAYAPAVFNIQPKFTVSLSKRSTGASKRSVYGRYIVCPCWFNKTTAFLSRRQASL